MTDHDVIPGTDSSGTDSSGTDSSGTGTPGTGIPAAERHPATGHPSSQAAGGSAARRGLAGRAGALIGRHKLGSAIAALLVAAAVVGVATGSLTSGAPAASTGSFGGQDDAIVYSSPAAAPAFSIPALLKSGTAPAGTGQRVSLTQYAGKPLIVNFFASWCEPCQQETPLLASFYTGNHGRVTIVGVDGNDAAASAIAFVHAKGVSYPVGVDPHLIIAGGYDVGAFPQTFFLDSRHRIVYRVIGGVTQAQLAEGGRLMDRS